MLIKATGINCYNIQLKPAGCANGGVAFVNIPVGSRIIGVKYLTTGNWPSDTDEDHMVSVTPNQENGFGMFEPYQVSGGRVWATYHNRSNDRDRFALIEVEYWPP